MFEFQVESLGLKLEPAELVVINVDASLGQINILVAHLELQVFICLL